MTIDHSDDFIGTRCLQPIVGLLLQRNNLIVVWTCLLGFQLTNGSQHKLTSAPLPTPRHQWLTVFVNLCHCISTSCTPLVIHKMSTLESVHQNQTTTDMGERV